MRRHLQLSVHCSTDTPTVHLQCTHVMHTCMVRIHALSEKTAGTSYVSILLYATVSIATFIAVHAYLEICNFAHNHESVIIVHSK